MTEFIPRIDDKVRRKVLAVSQNYYKNGKIVFINEKHRFYGVEFKPRAEAFFSSRHAPMRKKPYIECYKY